MKYLQLLKEREFILDIQKGLEKNPVARSKVKVKLYWESKLKDIDAKIKNYGSETDLIMMTTETDGVIKKSLLALSEEEISDYMAINHKGIIYHLKKIRTGFNI